MTTRSVPALVRVGLAGLLCTWLPACSGATSEPSAQTRTAGSPVSASPSPSPSASAPSSAPARSVAPRRTPTPTPTPEPEPEPAPRAENPSAEDLVTGLTVPWGLAPMPDGTVLVSERDTGEIKHVDGDEARTLTTVSGVEAGGEGGLLGLLLSKDKDTLFAYFTAANDNRIVAMSWDGQDLGEPEEILTGIPKGFRHNGGQLALGPDGFLYVGTGEVGDTSLAQDTDSLGGKILRITSDGKPAPNNPFDNEVWSYGHRNVEGLAFDDKGRLWASEFGDQTWDELNLIRKGGNYGWPEVEGSGDDDSYLNPKVVWRTDEASPAGLAYWQGELWMAALRGARLWEIPLDGTKAEEPKQHFADDYGRLRAVVVAGNGRDLLVSSSNTDGRGEVRSGDDRILTVTR